MSTRLLSVCNLYLYVQTYVLGWVGCPHICLVQLWMGRLYILANIYFEMGMLPSPMFGAAWDGYVVRPWPNSCLLSVWGLSGIGHGTAHSRSAILPCHQLLVKEENINNNNNNNNTKSFQLQGKLPTNCPALSHSSLFYPKVWLSQRILCIDHKWESRR